MRFLVFKEVGPSDFFVVASAERILMRKSEYCMEGGGKATNIWLNFSAAVAFPPEILPRGQIQTIALLP